MAIIEVSIGRAKYKVECPQSQHARLLYLASKADERVKDLLYNLQNADEKTLLALCLLNAEEEIETMVVKASHQRDLENLRKNADKNASEKTQENVFVEKINDEEMYEALAENIENVAEYIEKLAKKIENY